MRTEFFHGLDTEGVEVTLQEYTNQGWRVNSIGQNEDGFWLLLELVPVPPISAQISGFGH